MLNLQLKLEPSMKEPKLISSLFTMTDEQAMWRVQNEDDPSAFARLMDRWEKPIFRLCARMTGDAHRGEDLKQETFSRVFARRKDYRPSSRFSTWLWRIALNLCYDELRKKQRRSKYLADPSPEPEENEPATDFPSSEPTPYSLVVQSEESELVRKALLRLDDEIRTVVVLRFCEGLKFREIAELLDTPESTINSRAAVGLARLTRLLEPQFGSRTSETSAKET
jgi:RNA polymerase sigma-70 factor (ECF subfamily)